MATKGWSFGALTDALKSAAFVDIGTLGGQIPTIDITAKRILVSGASGALSGFQATGAEQNNAYLISNGDRIANGLVNSVQFDWYANGVSFGLVRDNGSGAVGYSTIMNGAARQTFSLKRNMHQFFGDVYAFNDIVIGRQSSAAGYDVTPTDWMRIRAQNATQFMLQHTARSWVFDGNGCIQPQQTLGGDASSAALRAQPISGSWDDWRGRNSLIQVDLTGAAASSGMKFTLWGTTEVGVIQAAYSGGRTLVKIATAQGAEFTLGGDGNAGAYFNTGLTTNGSLVSNASVSAGGGTSTLQVNGDVYGPLWNGYISSWLNSQLAARDSNISNAYNRGSDAYNLAVGCVREVRWANERRANAGGRHQPITGLDGNGDNAVTSDLQCYRSDAGGWYTTSWV